MAQGSQQYSAAQILEAGRRAHAEGRMDHAVQFYRHLTEHLAFTPEAAVAEQTMQRLGLASPKTSLSTLNGATSSYNGTAAQAGPPGMTPATQPRPAPSSRPSTAAMADSESAAQRKLLLPRLRRRYRTGRFIAGVVTFLGFVIVGSGTGLFILAVLTIAGVALPAAIPAILVSQPPMIGATGGLTLVFIGGLIALGGQLGRAMFDQASAARDLASLARLRAQYDARATETAGSSHH